MADAIASSIVLLFYAYVACGTAFAIAFALSGITRIDHEARGSNWIFRLIVTPGAIALWPLLARRWASGMSEPPLQKDPHR